MVGEMVEINIVKKAKEFATKAHGNINQRRKYTNEPYIVHPASVAKLVSDITDDEEMISAGWLHDVVEDTNITIEEIRKEFGNNIALLVSELTDISKPEDGNRKTRKQIDLEHISIASLRAKTIKLADLIDNSHSIAENDAKFAKIYMKEKKALLGVLKEGNNILYANAKFIVDEYFNKWEQK